MIIVAALAATACTSTRIAPRDQLTQLTRGQLEHGVVVTTDSRWRSRLDPNAKIRLLDRSGARSPQYRAGALSVNDRGISVIERLPFGRVDRARVGGLDAAATAVLATTRPAGATLARRGEIYELAAAAPELVDWLREFVTGVVALEASRARFWIEPGRDGRPFSWTSAHRLDPLRDVGGSDDSTASPPPDLEAIARAQPVSRMGRWQLHAGEHGWRAVHERSRRPAGHGTGAAILDVTEDGVDVEVGWAWSEIAGAEVTDVSGGKTLAAVVAVTVASAIVIPAAMLLGGASDAIGPSRPRGSSSSVTRAARVVERVAIAGEIGGRPAGAWQGHRLEPGSRPPVRMFAFGARRRAIVRGFAFAEVGTELATVDVATAGIAGGIRLFDLVELGGGIRRLSASLPGRVRHADVVGFGRVGLDLPLDAAHRVAFALGIDVGRAADVNLFRLGAGIRLRIGDRWRVGLQPYSPTRTSYHGDSPARGLPRWSWTTVLEVGAAI